ncbi:MAG: phosphatidate cytidylyltransferase [Planctomycetota bacterium]|nr:phosphatidate cytidylyltransferase [Planctomycetota bacterium]
MNLSLGCAEVQRASLFKFAFLLSTGLLQLWLAILVLSVTLSPILLAEQEAIPLETDAKSTVDSEDVVNGVEEPISTMAADSSESGNGDSASHAEASDLSASSAEDPDSQSESKLDEGGASKADSASNESRKEESKDEAKESSTVSSFNTQPQATPPMLPASGQVTLQRGGQNFGLNNLRTNILLGVVLAILVVSYVVGFYLKRQSSEKVNAALIRRFRQRVNAWIMMCAMLVFGLLLGSFGVIVIFGLVSFWALREFITMAPTRRGDHRALFLALIVFTPLQYMLIGLEAWGVKSWTTGRLIDFYGLYSIMIPVYASLYIPARIAISGDHKRFLERSAQITFGLLICVYSLSYAPALLNMKLRFSSGQAFDGSTAGLLFYLILISQLSDILQWTWGHFAGKRIIAPEISTSRTWEGFLGGTLSTGLVGSALFWVTPFTFWESACIAMVISAMGMFGGMAMSAIKRDRGVNDYGSLVLGHAGILDRIDTLCFAAPVFYHLTRFFYS